MFFSPGVVTKSQTNLVALPMPNLVLKDPQAEANKRRGERQINDTLKTVLTKQRFYLF